MSPLTPYPAERRVQRYAFVALGAAVTLSLLLGGLAPTRVLGVPAPAGLLALAALAGGALGVAAILRRRAGLALAASGALVLGTLRGVRPEAAGYALGIAFGLALVAFAELVHTAQRYERAHRVVESERSPEESLNRVTDETVKTLATRLGLAALVVAAGAGLASLLVFVGPAPWRAAVEAAAPLGVALATLTLVGALSLYVLLRGATFRRDASPEVVSDVAE